MLEERRSGSNSSASSSYVKPSDPSVDADGDGNTPDIFDEVEAEEEAQAAAEAAEAAARKEEAAKEDVSDKLPYKGMDESLIDKTWLGPHEESETLELHNGWAQGEAQKYSWFSKNGKGDEIFTAYVQDGVVVRVVKGLSATDYWPDLFGLPDLYASGTCDEASQWPDRPDPADYDNAEDYWDSLDAYRQHTGDMSGTYEDPYDEWDMDHW